MLNRYSQLAKRYAKSLLAVAVDRHNLDQVDAEIGTLRHILDICPEMQKALSNPVLPKTSRRALLQSLAKQAHLSESVASFLQAILKNNRTPYLTEIMGAFSALVKEHKGMVTAYVTSAVALDDKQVKQLEDQLSVNEGKKITLDVTIDPTILGGLIVSIGSKMWNDSIDEKINYLHRLSKQAIASL